MNKLNNLYNSDNKTSVNLHSLKNTAKKLAKYSPALLVAGIVPAEAQIVCNDDAAPITLNQGTYSSPGQAYIDMNNDGIDDFRLRNQTSFFGYGNAVYLAANPTYNAMWIADSSSYPSKLDLGSAIGPTLTSNQTFSTGSYGTIAVPYYGWGNFNPPSNGYVGVKFESGADVHFGWIQLSTAGSDVTIEGFCYESTPNTPISAGMRDIELIPTLGEWGLIILNLLLMIFGVVAIKQNDKIIIRS